MPVGHGPWAFSFKGFQIRAVAFIDGFNLYHAVDDHGQPRLKWLDVKALIQIFVPTPQFDLIDVYYFSAYATWRPAAFKRHREYVKALKTTGVTDVIGQFKQKNRGCHSCGSRWLAHEEKETDVNIAVHMLDGAYRNEYDRAVLVTGDSDLAPPVEMVRRRFPEKTIKILTPIGRNHSRELVAAAGGLKNAKKLQQIHLQRCLLPSQILDSEGNVLASCPTGWA